MLLDIKSDRDQECQLYFSFFCFYHNQGPFEKKSIQFSIITASMEELERAQMRHSYAGQRGGRPQLATR